MTKKAKQTEDKPQAKVRRRVRCPVCEGHGEPVEDNGQVCECENCHVRFLNPRPSAGELTALRNKQFAGALTANHGTAMREDANVALDAMKGYHRMVSGKDAPLNAFGKRVLDVGSGLGFRLREFEKYGWTVIGLESSGNAMAYTQAVALQVVQADIDAIPSGRFNFILFEGGLDQMLDPAKAVASLKDALTPAGVVYVSVNVDAPLEGERLYSFGEDGLRRLFMSNGLAEPEVREDDGKLMMWFKRK